MKGKYIILNKDTAPLLVHRIKKMQSITGKLSNQWVYTGQQKVAGYLQSIDIKNYMLIPVTKSYPSYIHKGDCKIEADNNPEMQLVRMNWDMNKYADQPGWEGYYGSGSMIPYGTKVYVSSNKIVYKDRRLSDKIGATVIIKPI